MYIKVFLESKNKELEESFKNSVSTAAKNEEAKKGIS